MSQKIRDAVKALDRLDTREFEAFLKLEGTESAHRADLDTIRDGLEEGLSYALTGGGRPRGAALTQEQADAAIARIQYEGKMTGEPAYTITGKGRREYTIPIKLGEPITAERIVYVNTTDEPVTVREALKGTQYEIPESPTGRNTSDKPRMQNIPVRTELGREVRERFGHRQRPTETSEPTTDKQGRTLYYECTINNRNVITPHEGQPTYNSFLPVHANRLIREGLASLTSEVQGEITRLRVWLEPARPAVQDTEPCPHCDAPPDKHHPRCTR